MKMKIQRNWKNCKKQEEETWMVKVIASIDTGQHRQPGEVAE
jgi:hypothetical protein